MNRLIAKKRGGVTSGIHLAAAGGGGGDGGSVAKHGTDVLSNVIVKPIFWGNQWFHPTTPPAGEILWAIRSIFKGPYMSGLAQYGVGKGALDPNPIFTGFAPDPPQDFTNADIEEMLKTFVDSGQIPDPRTSPQVLACVFTPIDIFFNDHDFNGFHNYLFRLANLPYAWVRNIGILEFITGVFSHELVEACTDPFMDAVFGDDGSCGQVGRCEIGDYCYGPTEGRGSGSLGGVNVSSYWSVQDVSCILPEERSVPGRVQGNPALLQGRFFSPGNFELATPLVAGGLAHYSRVNIDPDLMGRSGNFCRKHWWVVRGRDHDPEQLHHGRPWKLGARCYLEWGAALVMA
jgi:hypothetical protein